MYILLPGAHTYWFQLQYKNRLILHRPYFFGGCGSKWMQVVFLRLNWEGGYSLLFYVARLRNSLSTEGVCLVAPVELLALNFISLD